MSMEYCADFSWCQCFTEKVSILDFLFDLIQMSKVLFETFNNSIENREVAGYNQLVDV